MWTNYLRVALRSLRRRPGYTLINVTGLAVGITVCLLIGLYVRNELSYDRHHENADRIYRVTREWISQQGTSTLHLARISAPIAPALDDEFPEILQATRIWGGGGLVSRGDRYFDEPRFYFADANVANVLTIPFLKGNPNTALVEPFTVVLTEEMARKYFGSEDALGQVLQLDDEYDLRVTGIIQDPPPTTHFDYDFLASLATLEALFPEARLSNWNGYNNYATYLLLQQGAAPDALEAQLPAFLERHQQSDPGKANRLHLQPLTDIHLRSHLDTEIAPNGDITYVYLFSLVAILVLLIACFNFSNLATAQAAQRAKEVGMRKVLGAQRPQLIKQFIGEALVLATLSVILAGVLIRLVLPAFSTFTGRTFTFTPSDLPVVLAALVTTTLLVGLAAGSYPALVLSRFHPMTVLKQAVRGSWHSRFRTVLVVAQFTISILLIMGVGGITRQLEYVQDKRLGFEQDHLVVLPSSGEIEQRFASIRQHLMTYPGVQSVTASQLVPSDALVNHIDVAAEGTGSQKTSASLPLLPIDFGFVETYGLDLVAGRAFSKDRASDSTQAFVLNEAAVQQLGWESPEDAIGQPFTMQGNSLQRQGQVIGVVKDFHFESLHEQIAPLVLFIMPERCRLVTVKIGGQDVPETLSFLEEQWATYRPNFPFSYFFVDERFDRLYRVEQRTGQTLSLFAGIAVLIACLGLYGLAAHAAEQRTREIGIRKVLGATAGQIVALLSRHFVKLVAIAFVLATPLAYLALRRWLQDFAYHIELGPWLFAGAGLLALSIALLTISYQAIRAALADPVNNIRYE